MYRWEPGNKARALTAPAPSDLLKATGMLPHVYEKSRSPPLLEVVRPQGEHKGACRGRGAKFQRNFVRVID